MPAGMRMVCVGVGVGAAKVFRRAFIGNLNLRMGKLGRLCEGMGNCRRHRCDDHREHGQPGCHGTLQFPFSHC